MVQKMQKILLLQWVQLTETIEETVDYLNAKGEKVGLIKVTFI